MWKVVETENKNRSWRNDFFLRMGGSRNEGREEVPDYTAGEALYGP